MGAFAVNELLSGKSNIVICQRNGDIEAVDINFALNLDRMYKGKLKPGDLDEYTPETIEEMKAEIEEKRRVIKETYAVAEKINL